MPCYRPFRAYQAADGAVRFSERSRDDPVRELWLACGKCVGCRLERSRQWAVRCMHEAQMHSENCFITLTYDEVHVPPGFSLRYKDFQLFMKKLRRMADQSIRFFMCGEYGGQHSRPHFHACLFGYDFRDKVAFRRVGGGAMLYRSPSLERLWPLGFSTIGAVTFESAAYVARYVMKKVDGAGASVDVCDNVDKNTGEVVGRVPEFCHMSLGRVPGDGIGGPWLKKFRSDVFPSGKVVANGVETKAPRYYDKQFASVDPDGFAALQFERELRARERVADNSDARLAVREAVALARMRQFKRKV